MCLALVVTEGYTGVQVLYPTGHSTGISLKFYRYSGDNGFSNNGVDLEALVRPEAKVLMIPLMMAVSYMSVVFFQVMVVSHVTVTLVMLFHGTLLVTW